MMRNPAPAPAAIPPIELFGKPPSETSVACTEGSVVWDAGVEVSKASVAEVVVEADDVVDSPETSVHTVVLVTNFDVPSDAWAMV